MYEVKMEIATNLHSPSGRVAVSAAERAKCGRTSPMMAERLHVIEHTSPSPSLGLRPSRREDEFIVRGVF